MKRKTSDKSVLSARRDLICASVVPNTIKTQKTLTLSDLGSKVPTRRIYGVQLISKQGSATLLQLVFPRESDGEIKRNVKSTKRSKLCVFIGYVLT